MLPVARGANGQPPRPPTRRVEDRRAVLEPGDRVRVAGVARVVQVQADGLAALERARHQLAHLARHADADRVGEDHLVRAGRGHPVRVLDHQPGVDVALERAAERDARPSP